MTTDVQNSAPRATYTVLEAANLLGVNAKTFYEAVKRNQVPAIKIGGRILVPKSALHEMLANAGPRVAAA